MAKSQATKKYPHGAIVPCRPTKLKKSKKVKSKGGKKVKPGVTPVPVATECEMCLICAGSVLRTGLVACVDGDPVLANDYPATGGPWGLAIDPAGQGGLVWVNQGG